MNCIDVVELPLVLADAEDGHDIGMMQPGRGAGLAVEPLDRGRRGVVREQDLQRRAAAQGQLDRLVDDPHAPSADLADDLEARDRRQLAAARLLARVSTRRVAARVDNVRGDRVLIARNQIAMEGPGP